MSTSVSGTQQIKALLWRQWLVKRRNWVTSTFELLSPVIVLSALVLAHALVDVELKPEHIRVLETQRTIEEVQNGVASWAETEISAACLDILENVTKPHPSFPSAPAQTPQQSLNPEADRLVDVLSSTQQEQLSHCLEKAWGSAGPLNELLIKALQDFIDRNGPLPLLSVDEFILLHKLLQAAFHSFPDELNLLRNVRNSLGRNILGNLLDLGQVAFTPATADVLQFADHMVKTHELFPDFFYGVFNTESEAEAYAKTASPPLWAIVSFSWGPNKSGSGYSIRMNYTCVPSASQKVNRHSHGVPRGYKRYFTSGFLSLQSAIEGYTLGLSAAAEADIGVFYGDKRETATYIAWASVFGTPAYTTNSFYEAIGPMLGLLASLSLIYPLSQLVRGVVEDKETRVVDTMAIMGLKTWVSPVAWVLTYGVIFLGIAIAMTVICNASLFPSTDASLLFVVFFLFCMSELAFGMMASSFFNNAKIAAISAPIVHFSFLMPRYIFFRTEENQAFAGKVCGALLSPSAFTFAADLFAKYEGGGHGLTWDSLWDDGFPAGLVMIMLSIDVVLYFCLAWYLPGVLPNEHVQTLPLHFPFKLSYWRRLGDPSSLRGDEEQSLVGSGDELSAGAAIVRIHGLRKEYGATVAVKAVSMSMLVGETTALLGHNGAGKSSLVGMVTGLVKPTSGDCSIMGKSIVHETAEARKNLGFCPQQNILFEQLTVMEHLLIFAAIKGIPGGLFGAAAYGAAEKILGEVGLEGKGDTAVKTLSGGMKRKLQVALALLGDSKVVLLDEPTSGVDPASRRALWTVLSKMKSGRAILLITHHTDEADILADQVAVMVDGLLLCTNSSLQLKQRFCNGYTLSIMFDVNKEVDACKRQTLDLVTAMVPNSFLLRSAATEVMIRLPMNATANFADFLSEIEGRQAAFGISHYSLSMPTLEEAFLEANNMVACKDTFEAADFHSRHCSGSPEQVGHPHQLVGDDSSIQPAPPSRCRMAQDLIDQTSAPSVDELRPMLDASGAVVSKDSQSIATDSVYRARVLRTPGLQRWVAFKQMLTKRGISAVRDKKAVLFALVLPLLAVCLAMTILKANIDLSSSTMLLDLAVPPQVEALPAFNLPDPLRACLAPGLRTSSQSICRGSLAFSDWGRSGNSLEMNRLLLDGMQAGSRPQYAALVFNDTIITEITRQVSESLDGKNSQRLLSGLSAALLGDSYKGLMNSTVGGIRAVLPLLLSREARVLMRMRLRFGSQAWPVNLMHNASAQHALPSLLSGIRETIGALSMESDGQQPRFIAHSNPLPLSLEESVELDSILMGLGALFVLIPFCLLSGAFCVNPVVERACGSQHLQLLSGCPPAIYWAGSYAWDMVTHLVVSLASLAVFVAFGDKATAGSLEQSSGSLLLLLCYGMAVIPLTYCYSLGFSSPSAAQVAASALNFALGFCAVCASYVMALIPKAQALQKVLVHVFRLMPPFLLGEGLIELTRVEFERTITRGSATRSTAEKPLQAHQAPESAHFGPAHDRPFSLTSRQVFEWGVLGRPVVLMLLEAAGLCSVLLLLDQYKRTGSFPEPLHRVCRGVPWVRRWIADYIVGGIWRLASSKVAQSTPMCREGSLHLEMGIMDSVVSVQGACRNSASEAMPVVEDESVSLERQRIASGTATNDTVVLEHLCKSYNGYPPKVALYDVCLSIRQGERFGLLGANGAGKSTIMGILTRHITASSGRALVNGVDVLDNQAGVTAKPGFCPQVDPLIDHMTAREQLAMFACLKGVQEFSLTSAVDEVLRHVTITEEMADRPALQYSGGNKRKLALGIALVGGVNALLLDEPSSGMDPGSRRAMWVFISEATGFGGGKSHGISTILTTHNLEECEAICSRVGILHKGRLLCLGSPTQLKGRYGAGYLVEIVGENDKDQQAAITSFIQDRLGGSLIVQHFGRAKFVIPAKCESLANAFRQLEKAKEGLRIEAYALSQPTLEQVFLTIVGDQSEVL